MNLCIYIPTWNRAQSVLKQLTAIEQQLLIDDSVRLVVSDNASTDSGYLEVRQWFETRSWAEYRRQPANVNGNANILLGFLAAREDEAVWILADDTILLDTALAVLRATLATNPDLVLLCDPQSASALAVAQGSGDPSDIIGTGAGLISNALYSQRAFGPSLVRAFEYHNSSFPHLAVLLDGASRQTLSIALVEVTKVHAGNVFERDADYGLSNTGFPLLLDLVPPQFARRMAFQWLLMNAYVLRRARRRFPDNYSAAIRRLKRTLGPVYPIAYATGWFAGLLYYRMRDRVGFLPLLRLTDGLRARLRRV